MTSSKDWFNALELSKKELKPWVNRGEKIVKRYRDERGEFGGGKRYNILWSNIRTLLPAVYAKKPRAQADRRYKDADPVGRCASEILERSLQYEIDQYSDFDSSLRHSVLDRLLPGRGVAWVRYEPTYEQSEEGEQITDDVEIEQTLVNEQSPVDYVFWKDFRHSPARTWEEVTWIARRVYMDKKEGIDRFGEEFANAPMTHEPVGMDDMKRDGMDTESMKKAVVWEIWDKSTKAVYWVAEGFAETLDEKPDPLGLDGFFPCPKPLFATLSTDSLVPVADFVLYQDQADEIDTLTERIGKLTEACKVVGVYDASQTGISRMLQEGVDNRLIPVDTWAAFGERGGLKGTIDFMPLDMVVNALGQLYQAREASKQVIYEVTGLSDIIRGASVASETATAQQIKSQYASLRLKEMQSDVARFASDILRIKAQIMCSFYSPQTLVDMSGMAQTQDAQYLPQAFELLKNNVLRNFRIEVETDSLVELDEVQEKQDRMEFLTAASGFIEKAVQAPPELAPLLGEMLMFGVRSFKAGKGMEASLEKFIKNANEQAKQPKPQQPNPEMLKLQAAQQSEQMAMQMEQAKMQASQQLEVGKFQLEQAKMQATQQAEQLRMQSEMEVARQKAEIECQMERARIDHEQAMELSRQEHEARLKQYEIDSKTQLERDKSELDNATKIQVAQISHQTAMDSANLTAQLSADNAKELAATQFAKEEANREVASTLGEDKIKPFMDMHMETMGALDNLINQIAKPKKRTGKKLLDGSFQIIEE
ncbi:MAG: molecular chaperone [Pseudomonadota bacterium]|nr:molecular chaperone [Pseudomonadota bacterium]